MTGLAAIGTGFQALSLLQRGRDMAASLFSSALAHPLAAGLALSLGVNLWQRHEASVQAHAAARRLAVWQQSFAGEQAAFASLMNSYHVVLNAAAGEKQSIDALSVASAQRQNTASQALAEATQRGHGLMALSSQLSAKADAAPVVHSPACQTPADVMDLRSQL